MNQNARTRRKAAANKRFSNAVNASKRILNSMHNTIKAHYNRGNRSSTLRNMAARYTAAKNTHKMFTTGAYERNNRFFRKPTRNEARQHHAANPEERTEANLESALMGAFGTRTRANELKNEVLQSERNVFEDFNIPALEENVPVAINRSAFNRLKSMKLSAENINNLRKGLNSGPTEGSNE
jgi:hypothetical protein